MKYAVLSILGGIVFMAVGMTMQNFFDVTSYPAYNFVGLIEGLIFAEILNRMVERDIQ